MQGIKDKINKVWENKDGKALISNFGYLSLLQVANYLFPLVTMPYLARVIGVEGFGKIAFAAAIMVWFQTISDWGFNYTATRDVARNRENKEVVSQIFSNVFWARCLLMIVSFLLLLLLIFFIPQFKENQTILLISFLLIPGHILFPDWFFQAIERMKYITVFNVISKFLFTIAVFFFIRQESDYILQPLLTSLGFVVSGIIAMYYILVQWKIKLYFPNVKEIRESIKKSTDVFINNLLPNLYNSFAILLLGLFGGPVSNGIYDASRKFTNLAHGVMQVFSRVFFPFLSRKIEKHDVFAKLYLLLTSFISLILFILAPVLIKFFFTSDFYDAILILRITSISVVLVALSSVYGRNYLIIEGYEKELRRITFTCSLVGFCVSLPLVYYLDVVGAALTLTFTQLILGLSIMRKALKLKKHNCKLIKTHA